MLSRSLYLSGHELLVISFKRQYPRWLYPGSTDRDPSQAPLRTAAEYLLDPLYPWTWVTTQRRIAAFSPDLVVIQWWTTFWALAFASISGYCRRKHIPVAYIVHNALPHEQRPWDRWLARRALGAGDTLIAQNPHEASRLLDLLPHAQVRTCEMPIYSGFAGEALSKSEARQRLGLAPDRDVLLFFGIVRPYKGLHVLLDALAILKKDGDTPLLIAAGEFWEEQQSYTEAIHQLGLESDVCIENRYIPDEELNGFFSAADALVAPYLAGTQSAAVALALGAGLPVVLTERIAAGVPPAYRRLTRVVPAGDAVALSQAIRDTLTEHPIPRPPLPNPESDWLRMVHLLETLAPAEIKPEQAL
jgi:glycosyltransferase involved in cell wall biosynthesis